MKEKSFFYDYAQMVIESIDNQHLGNYDEFRFGRKGRYLALLVQSVDRILAALGLFRKRKAISYIESALGMVQSNLSEFEWLYRLLNDRDSRRTLVEVIAYRALGHPHVKLSLNTPQYWNNIQRMEQLAANAEEYGPIGSMGWHLYEIKLQSIGYPMVVLTMPRGANCQFVLQPYRYQNGEHVIETGEGDHIIDAGAGYGDTALYLAHHVGESGKVFSFEFSPGNLEIFRRNMQLNPSYANRIQLIERPLWSSSGKDLFIEGHGLATRISEKPTDTEVRRVSTLSIDQFASEQQVSRIDFIKMDIEGAELEALRGAETVISQFKPKLAISVYHRLDDFWTIPQFLDSLNLGYMFYLRHCSIHAEETILFAEVAGRQ